MLQLLLSILCIVQYVICRYSLAYNVFGLGEGGGFHHLGSAEIDAVNHPDSYLDD
jgi:hypothetical protein